MAEADDIRKNTQDIHELTVNVTRLATIVENSEKRHDSDMEMMKEAIQGISRLNERIGDVGAMRELVSELKGDIRTIRHDLNNATNAIAGIGIVNEKLNEATSTIAAQGAKIEGLADRVNNIEKKDANRDGKVAGIQGAAKTFWSVFSGPIWAAAGAVAVWILSGMYGGKGMPGGE